MDGFQEKKWFLYLVDHHEGPFSLEEIQLKMEAGQVTLHNFVWAEGMGDWKAMPEVPEFTSILKPSHKDIKVLNDRHKEPSIQMDHKTGPLSGPEVTFDSLPKELSKPIDTRSIGKCSNRGWLLLLLITGFFGLIGFAGYKGLIPTDKLRELVRPVMIESLEKFPFLMTWISPIPEIEDVKRDDYELLKKTAITSFKNEGPNISLAVSQGESSSPSLWISGNLPDGFMLDVYLEGVPETLLNATECFIKSQAVILNRIGKTSVFKLLDGPLPKGRYLIYVTESDKIPDEAKPAFDVMRPAITQLPAGIPRDRKFIVKKTVFIGGPENIQYQTRLKEYHEKLKQEADRELAELAQFTAAFENQLEATNKEITRIRAKTKVIAIQKKLWTVYNEQWLKLHGSIEDQFKQWTPDVLKGFFYSLLYVSVQNVSQVVLKVHQLNNSYFEGVKDVVAFNVQHDEANVQAITQLGQLKVKLEEMEKLSPTPNGMPRRDGL